MANVVTKNKGHYRGLALVAVLWVVVLLTVIVTVVGKTVRLDSYVSQSTAQEVCGRWAMRAGVEKAIALLNEDTKASDCLTDLWSENNEDCNNIILDECILDIKITDEAAKLNINTATKEQLMRLPYMSSDIADAIIDWRDENEEPEQDGAEGGYYLNLDPGYNIRNGPFRTLKELLLVRGVTEELFYGEDTNFNGKLDRNECDGDERAPIDNEDDVLDKGWMEYLTCYSYDKNEDSQGQERININSADEKELTESLGISKPHAKWIVENRKENYNSIADLINKDSKKESDKKEAKDEDDSDKVEAEPLDMETFSGIADKIAVKGDERIAGRININTASSRILTVLLEGNGELAENIIAYREGSSEMENIADLLNVKGMEVETFKTIAEYVTTRSNVFTVKCEARSAIVKAMYQKTAVVDRGEAPGTILYWY